MPFARPTLTQLRDGALQDVAAQQIYDATTQELVNPLLIQFDPLTIMAKVQAGLAYEEYGYLDYIALQATPATATDEAALAWGSLIGVTPEPATAASAALLVTGSAGRDIPAGTVFVRADGVSYASSIDVLIPAGNSAIVPVTAIATGALGTIAAGAALTMQVQLQGVAADVTVLTSVAPGTDIEPEDAFRARYLRQYAAPPSGGSQSDYQEWALAVPGVTRAWAQGELAGPGTVSVFVMLDNADAVSGGFPQGSNGVAAGETRAAAATGDQLTVANALYPLRPVTDLLYVVAPTPLPVDFALANLGTANTAANQAAVRTALQALFLTLGTALGGTIYPSAWEGAITRVLGAIQFTLSSPVAPITAPIGSLLVLGNLVMTA